MFGTVLVANRGEIARRVIRTLRAARHPLGGDLHRRRRAARRTCARPTRRCRVGSYLSIDDVVGAAAGADALHPGYGFLSENAGLARACAEAGIVFVGPSPEAIELMGDKVRAKEAAARAGVPVVESLSVDEARASDAYPLLVKAAAGGGGRGMRVVESPDGARRGARRGAARGAGGLRRRPRVHRALPAARAAHRGAGHRRPPRRP